MDEETELAKVLKLRQWCITTVSTCLNLQTIEELLLAAHNMEKYLQGDYQPQGTQTQ